MAKGHVRHALYAQNGRDRSIEDQIHVAHNMWDNGFGQLSDGLKRSNTENELDIELEFTPETVLENLYGAGVVEKEPEDFEDLMTYAIAQWIDDGEIVNGEVTENAEEAIDALIEHMHEEDPSTGSSGAVADGAGVTIRQVVSDELEVVPSAVEAALRDGDAVDKIRQVVGVLREHPDVETGEEYGTITFRNEAYRYRLSEPAERLYRK